MGTTLLKLSQNIVGGRRRFLSLLLWLWLLLLLPTWSLLLWILEVHTIYIHTNMYVYIHIKLRYTYNVWKCEQSLNPLPYVHTHTNKKLSFKIKNGIWKWYIICKCDIYIHACKRLYQIKLVSIKYICVCTYCVNMYKMCMYQIFCTEIIRMTWTTFMNHELRSRGRSIIHGLEATEMAQHVALRGILFDRIVFNFPHAGFFQVNPRSGNYLLIN